MQRRTVLDEEAVKVNGKAEGISERMSENSD